LPRKGATGWGGGREGGGENVPFGRSIPVNLQGKRSFVKVAIDGTKKKRFKAGGGGEDKGV